jgi:hypothetical protein
VEASLAAEIRRQVRPYWQRNAPTGADVGALKTTVRLHLARDGTVASLDANTIGQTASNRPQAALHKERALKSVRLAAPFKLPAEFYDAWKDIEVTLDLRLSQ